MPPGMADSHRHRRPAPGERARTGNWTRYAGHAINRSMQLPPPLIVTLKDKQDPARRAQIIADIRNVKGVIDASPRDPKDPDGRVLTVVYFPGSPIHEELGKMTGISTVGVAPPLPLKPRPPAP